MTAFTSPAVLRLSAAATLPHASVERMTRPLIELDRWPSRSRPVLLASDLGSMLNAMLGVHPTYAGESDTLLRSLEFKGAWPLGDDPQPMFPARTWGELLDGLIEAMPHVPDPEVKQAASSAPAGSLHLPHRIESCLNPAGVILTWLGEDGERKRQEFYAPPPHQQPSHPYGRATLLVRKSFMSSDLIVIAGQILRDTQAAAARKAKAPSRNAQAKSAALAGAAPLRDDQDRTSSRPIPEADTPEAKRECVNTQAEKMRGPGASLSRVKDRPHEPRPRSTSRPVGQAP